MSPLFKLDNIGGLGLQSYKKIKTFVVALSRYANDLEKESRRFKNGILKKIEQPVPSYISNDEKYNVFLSQISSIDKKIFDLDCALKALLDSLKEVRFSDEKPPELKSKHNWEIFKMPLNSLDSIKKIENLCLLSQDSSIDMDRSVSKPLDRIYNFLLKTQENRKIWQEIFSSESKSFYYDFFTCIGRLPEYWNDSKEKKNSSERLKRFRTIKDILKSLKSEYRYLGFTDRKLIMRYPHSQNIFQSIGLILGEIETYFPKTSDDLLDQRLELSYIFKEKYPAARPKQLLHSLSFRNYTARELFLIFKSYSGSNRGIQRIVFELINILFEDQPIEQSGLSKILRDLK